MKKKLCIVGYGGMGGWHARHAIDSDVVELAGVFDINEARHDVAHEKGILPEGLTLP